MKTPGKRTLDKEDVSQTISLPIGLFTAFLLLHIIPIFGGHPKLWGVDQWRYLGLPAAFVFLSFGLLVVVSSGFRSFCARTVAWIGALNPVRRTDRAKAGGLLALCVVSAILFWRLRNATHFLGDGYLWADHLTTNVVFNEPVTSWLYRAAFRLMKALWLSGTLSPTDAAAIISGASGIVFLVFAWLTVRTLTKEAREYRFLLLSLLSTGTMLLFFGYVEPYPPLAASVMAFIYYGIRFIQQKSGYVAVIAAFIVMVLLHFSSLAMIPALAVLFPIRKGRMISGRKLHLSLVAMVAAGVAVLWVLQRGRMFSGFFFEKFVPLFPGPHRNRIAYPIFSWKTLFDAFNELILICPIALLIFAGLRRSNGPRSERTNGILPFLETITVFYLMEFLLFNKNIGVSRDWDLFAPLAIPIALLTGLVLLDRYRRRTSTLSAIAFSIIIVHTAPWVALNAIKDTSLKRFVDLVENGYWSDYAKGYGYSTLGFYFKRMSDNGRAVRFMKAASEADEGNTRYLYNLATLYAEGNDYEKATGIYEKVIERDPGRLDARYNLGLNYMKSGKMELAENQFAEILRRDSSYVQSFEPYEMVSFDMGKIDRCIELYRKAKKLGVDTAPRLLALASKPGGPAERERGKMLLEKLSAIEPGDPAPYRVLARLSLADGDARKALIYLDQGMRIAQDRSDIVILNNIGARYFDRGEPAKAAQVFVRAIKLYPSDPGLRINLARTYHKLGDSPNAWRQVFAAESLKAKVPRDFLDDLQRSMPRPRR
jgi:tetratricopeptide (TPR) repeat protein